MYAAWNPEQTSAGISPVGDVAEPRATSVAPHPECGEAAQRVSSGEMLNLSPLCGGLPPDLWPYPKRVGEVVLPGLHGRPALRHRVTGLVMHRNELISTKRVDSDRRNAVICTTIRLISISMTTVWLQSGGGCATTPLFITTKFNFYALSRYEDVSREL
jgi:hypothetical protein